MILKRFQDFKHTVPVMGAILLSPRMDKVLLVRGWSKNAAWGFPRGKRTKDETDEICAIREVRLLCPCPIKRTTNSQCLTRCMKRQGLISKAV